MPDAVSDRPPRKGPTRRYLIPLKFGSSFSFFCESSALAGSGARAAAFAFCFSAFVLCAKPEGTKNEMIAINHASRIVDRVRVPICTGFSRGVSQQGMLILVGAQG